MLDKESAVYKRYLEKYDPNSDLSIRKLKSEKHLKRMKWWSDNWIGFSGLVVAVIALIVSLLALLT